MAGIRKFHKTNTKRVETGHMMALVHFVQVAGVRANGDAIDVRDLERGGPLIGVNGYDLVASAYSADLFEETVKATQTELLEVFVTLFNQPFTVHFKTQEGEERTLRGKYVEHDAMRGQAGRIEQFVGISTTDTNMWQGAAGCQIITVQ